MKMNYELIAPSDLSEEQQRQIGNFDMNVGATKGALDDDDKKAITGFAGQYLFRGPNYLGRVDTSKSGADVAQQMLDNLRQSGQLINV